jgi:hypothetical protein
MTEAIMSGRPKPARCWKNWLVKPYETSVGLFVISNAILTFFPNSAVIQLLELHFGKMSIIFPISQILAGLLKVIGIYMGRANWQAAGMLMVNFLMGIRIVSHLSDGEVTLYDINSLIICVLIIVTNAVLLKQIFQNKEVVQV